MTRRAFDETAQNLQASILEHCARFFEDRGLPFDKAAYEAQSSYRLDDVTRELLFFGAEIFPDSMQIASSDRITIAA
ncbi:hypothetical protein HJB53_30115 [Rhizobium lentis]|uniref:hypothetical protein n=1 Tax=Rhizobium lentis TaxID=1138194 RepID=UPI001C837B21|nr:hypothetical protein [Rhizobium lentis]MBX5130747.1 hypothetical protein [Rhizobium lentis]